MQINGRKGGREGKRREGREEGKREGGGCLGYDNVYVCVYWVSAS